MVSCRFSLKSPIKPSDFGPFWLQRTLPGSPRRRRPGALGAQRSRRGRSGIMDAEGAAGAAFFWEDIKMGDSSWLPSGKL